MAQNGPIIIKNAADANVTLTPAYKEGLIAVFSDRSAAAGLQTELSLGLRKPKAGVNDKVTIKLAIPYAVVDGDVTTIETVTAFVEVVVPHAAPVTIRNELVAGVSSVVNDVIVNDLLINNGFPY